MANIQVQLRRGTTSDHATFAGAEGEVTVDTDLDTLMVHTGGGSGTGVRLAKHSELSAGGGGTVVSIASGTGLTGGPITTSGTLSLASIANLRALGNVSGTTDAPVAVEIKDDDTMATASATSLATSESIKAYVDSQLGANRSWSTFTEGTGVGQRQIGTTYTNNTGGEIEVHFTGSYPATYTGTRQFSLEVNISGTFVIIDNYRLGQTNVITHNSVSGSVPNNTQYKITATTSSLTFQQWAELSS